MNYKLLYIIGITLFALSSCGSGNEKGVNEESADPAGQDTTRRVMMTAEEMAEAQRLDSIRQDSIIEAELRAIDKREKKAAMDFNKALPDIKKLHDLSVDKQQEYLRNLGFTGSLKGDNGEFELSAGTRRCLVKINSRKTDTVKTEEFSTTIEGDPEALKSFYKKTKLLEKQSRGDLTIKVEKKDNTVTAIFSTVIFSLPF